MDVKKPQLDSSMRAGIALLNYARRVIKKLKQGDCWCGSLDGQHTDACNYAREFMEMT